MVMQLSVDGIGYSNSKKKWFIYDTAVDYNPSPEWQRYHGKPSREDEYTKYYDTFEDASIELAIIQERYKGCI